MAFGAQEIEDLKKSLAHLNLTEEEIEVVIEKAIREKSEEPEEGKPGAETVKEMAEGEGTEKEEKPEEGKEEKEDDEEIKKAKMREEYPALKARMEEIEKCLGTEIKKSVEEDIQKSIENDIQKSLDSRFEDIQKSIGEGLEDIQKSFGEKLEGIQKSYNDKIKDLEATVKKIAETPIPMKSLFTKANLFQKSIGGDDDEIGGERTLSISRDKDALIKAISDEFESATDPEVKAMLGQGLSDITISPIPNAHGSKAIAFVSKKQNITITQ